MHSRLRPCTLAIVALLFLPGLRATAQGQTTVRVVPLGSPNATLTEEFARLLAVRELAGGRVLLTDDKDKRLVHQRVLAQPTDVRILR